MFIKCFYASVSKISVSLFTFSGNYLGVSTGSRIQWFVSVSFHCCNKLPKLNILEEEHFILAQGFKECSPR